ncbi:MAG TPA: exodeoxyribonuclease VII large subunit [Gemmatimonadaceae bacterium]|nr:exodeoxyribonuclease VII large subunit [Gemmatimonadaceae bacterium]
MSPPPSSYQHGLDFEPTPDAVPGADPTSAIGVSALTNLARDVLEGAFHPLWVRGEVTGFKAHRNGHWYFTLRDRMAQIRSVVWSKDTRGIPAPPDEGMQIAAFGNLSVYPQKGEMQFVVRRMEAEGDGLWRKRLEMTRLKLEKEGLLDPARKRRLPRYPRRVAVVTSPDGAALRDIVAVMRRRARGVQIIVVPAAVQGDSAVKDLCAAIERVGRWGAADVVIVGRGGGSREDLQAFNDERVARAIAKCPTPVISAVGHEVDVTICDLVADVRAATPSAAAETVVRDEAELASELRNVGRRLSRALRKRVDGAKAELQWTASALQARVTRLAERRRARVAHLGARLHALSPLATLDRGYALARGEDGRPLTHVAAFDTDMAFDLVLRDGRVAARVTEVKEADPSRRSG